MRLGVVVLQGSGPEGRWEPRSRIIATTVVRNGFAVLTSDTRGVGGSTGDVSVPCTGRR